MGRRLWRACPLGYLLFYALAWGVTAVGAARAVPVLAEYDLYAQDCLKGSFPDNTVGLGPIKVSKPGSMCISGGGVANYDSTTYPGALAYSTGSFTSVSSLTTTSMTLEAWLRFRSATTGVNSSSVILSVSSSGGRDLLVVQQQYNVLVKYFPRGSGGGKGATGLLLNAGVTPLTAPFHLAVLARPQSGLTRYQIYINGTLRTSTPGALRSPNFWNSSSQLYLFSEPAGVGEAAGHTGWRGDIHLLALYNRTLSASEILANYKAGYAVVSPTASPSLSPTSRPTTTPTRLPSALPTQIPTSWPSRQPTLAPSGESAIQYFLEWRDHRPQHAVVMQGCQRIARLSPQARHRVNSPPAVQLL